MHIFISHAAANARLARTLAEAFEHLGATTFIASRAGDIRADEDWLRGIERALQEADAYIVLLTPESTFRPWINFEAGAAWFSERQLLFLRVQALAPGDIPLPISSRQVYALDDVEQFGAVLDALRLPRNGVRDIVARLAAEGAEAVPAGENEQAWEGVLIQGVYYAWAGPLVNLQDRDAVPPPQTLLQEIERRGLHARWGNHDRLAHHVQRGLAQVFATDRETWRRPVADRGHLLLVGQN
jgi:hypothetical protein